MNDGKKRQSSAELPAHKRFEKSRSRWIYPSFQNTVFVFCGDWGSAPTSMKQAGPVWTESACFRKVGTALHCLPVLSRIRIILEQPPFSLFRMMEAAGTTEELKARNPMRWAGLMNTLKAQVEEVLLQELVYI